jgi:hypothetical protein
MVVAEMRAQRVEPCRRDPNDCRHADDGWCGSDECNGDGTRWVTVGTLVADEDTDYSYIIKENTDG